MYSWHAQKSLEPNEGMLYGGFSHSSSRCVVYAAKRLGPGKVVIKVAEAVSGGQQFVPCMIVHSYASLIRDCT